MPHVVPSAHDLRLSCSAWLALATISGGLILRAERYRHAGRALGEVRTLPPAPEPLARSIAAHVERVARVVPRATCLARALAVRSLLARRGYGSEVHVGVARLGKDGRFAAHAWLSCNGTTILGNNVPGFADYAALLEIH